MYISGNYLGWPMNLSLCHMSLLLILFSTAVQIKGLNLERSLEFQRGLSRWMLLFPVTDSFLINQNPATESKIQLKNDLHKNTSEDQETKIFYQDLRANKQSKRPQKNLQLRGSPII